MTSGTTHRIPGALPPQSTGFVGREAEIAQVSAALMESRLVTIVGTGGVGKTRVATSLMLYWRLSGRLREGEYWLNRVLDRCPRPSPARARVLAVRGYVTALIGDLHAAHTDAKAAVGADEA